MSLNNTHSMRNTQFWLSVWTLKACASVCHTRTLKLFIMLIANFFSFMLYMSDFKIPCWIWVKLYKLNHFWMISRFSAFFWFWLRLQLYCVLKSECWCREFLYQCCSRGFRSPLTVIKCFVIVFSCSICEGHSQAVIVSIHWIKTFFSCTDSCWQPLWKAFTDCLSFQWACRVDQNRL